MDSRRFDAFARSIAATSSRRQVLRRLFAGITAGVLNLANSGEESRASSCPLQLCFPPEYFDPNTCSCESRRPSNCSVLYCPLPYYFDPYTCDCVCPYLCTTTELHHCTKTKKDCPCEFGLDIVRCDDGTCIVCGMQDTLLDSVACTCGCPSGAGWCPVEGGVNCVDTTSNLGHCGGCGKACPDVTQTGSAELGYRYSSATFGCCSGQCIDILTDPGNCGDCGMVCQSGKICCNGQCIDSSSDASHCGNCGTVCHSEKICCNGYCANLNSDTDHCGSCGIECTSAERCSEGKCYCAASDPTFEYFKSNPSDAYISLGDSVTFSWGIDGCSLDCEVSLEGVQDGVRVLYIANLRNGGSIAVTPPAGYTTRYTLTADAPCGHVSKYIDVEPYQGQGNSSVPCKLFWFVFKSQSFTLPCFTESICAANADVAAQLAKYEQGYQAELIDASSAASACH